MKILHINASYKPAFVYGGPTVSVAKLCEEMGSRRSEDGGQRTEGFDSAQPDKGVDLLGSEFAQPESSVEKEKIEVTVYTTLANGQEELPYQNGEVRNVEGVAVRYFKRITKDHSHFSPALLRHLWKNVKQFDLIHIHAWWNLVSVGAALICVLKGRSYLLSPRGTLSAYSFYNRKSVLKRIFHLLVGKPLLKRAVFQVSSGKEKKDIENILGFSCKVMIIPNFVELKKAWETVPDVERKHSRAELLFFSRVEEKKGLEFLLEACALLTIPYHLTIAGSGEESYVSDLKNLVKRLGTDEKTTWLGQVAAADKFAVLANYDLLILPSYDENFANVVIESLACGTPVLLSPNVGLADYVLEKQLGWIVEQNPAMIVAAIENLFHKDKQELSALRKKARQLIKTDFEEATLRKTYIQFYQSMNK